MIVKTRNVMKPLKTIFLCAGLGLASFQFGCAPVELLNGLTSNQAFSLLKDQSYGPLDIQTLDIYKPTNPKENAPVILFVYGGGWNHGTKNIYKFMGEAFSAAGYTTVIPEYRTYPEVIYPSFVEDVAIATAWTHENFDAPIVAIGHSAGAHITSLLALRPDYLADHDLTACEAFSGWVGLAGPYDFKVWEEPYLSIFPQELREVDIQPISYVANSTLPALIITGAEDKVVGADQSLRMADALRAVGTPVTHKVYKNTGHLAVISRMSKLLRKKNNVYADIMKFVEELPTQRNCAKPSK